ncbi:hypothetical protein [Paenibacillus sp. S29]|uniref:hypothetical protein n=1 Tax=Paenibacillus sp. S29 TaxID=3394611 RepID=UPI0039BFA3F2
MDREEAKKIFKKLAASYPSWKVDKDIAESWIEELETADAENCWANVSEHIRTSKFAPSLAEIIRPNERIEAKREIERTREMIRRQDEERKDIPKDPPWVREGISRQAWMQRLLAEKRAEAQ